MRAVTALLVAAVCIQAAGAVSMKSRLFKERAQTQGVADSRWYDLESVGQWHRFFKKGYSVDVADDGTIIASNQNDDVYVQFGPRGEWTQLPGRKMVQVSTGGKGLYVGVSSGWKLFLWVNGQWVEQNGYKGYTAWASIGSDGTIWAVGKKGEVTNEWGNLRAPGVTCKQVYVANAATQACLDNAGRTLIRQDGQWFTINSAFNKIAISSSRSVVATTANGEIYYTPLVSPVGKWEKIPGEFKNVGISKDYIVGATSAGRIQWKDLKQ